MAGDSFELGEGIITLKGDPKAWKLALDDMEKDVVAHEQKVTSLTWKAAQLRAEGIRKIAERANAAVRKFMDTGKYGAPAAALLAREREVKVTQEITYQQNAAKHGRPVADYLEAKRDQKEEKRNQKLVDAFKYGRVGGAIVGGARSFNERVQAAQPAGAAGVAVGAAGIGLAAAASPLAYSTLTESMTLLAATVGRDLQPALLNFAFKLQDISNWWGKLAPETKRTAANLTEVAATAGAVTVGLGLLTKGLSFLGRLGPLGIGAGIFAGLATARGQSEEFQPEGDAAKRKALIQEYNTLQDHIKGMRDGDEVMAGLARREFLARKLGVNPRADNKMADAVGAIGEKSGKLGSFGPSSFSSSASFSGKCSSTRRAGVSSSRRR
jgi:hypothetical protein